MVRTEMKRNKVVDTSELIILRSTTKSCKIRSFKDILYIGMYWRRKRKGA
jgi:hypothetical protein